MKREKLQEGEENTFYYYRELSGDQLVALGVSHFFFSSSLFLPKENDEGERRAS